MDLRDERRLGSVIETNFLADRASCQGRCSRRLRRRGPSCRAQGMLLVRVSVHRYYDPTTGQFVSVDPMVNQTGQPYAYTSGDPVNEIDPQGLFGWGSIVSVVTNVARVVHAVAKVTTAVAGLCAVGAGLLGAEPVAAACGVVAVASAGVQVLSGAALVATNNESLGQFGLDAASLGLSGTGLGLARLSGNLADSAESFGSAAGSASWWQPVAKAGLYLRQSLYSGLSSLAYLGGLGIEAGGNALDWYGLAGSSRAC